MNKMVAAFASTLVLGFASSTWAADLPARMPVKAPPPAVVAVYNWTGFYIGGNVGAAWLRKSVEEIGPGVIAEDIGSKFSLTRAGITAGGQAGYNWHVNNWLLGVEADFNWTGINRTIPVGVDDDNLVGKVNWFATFRGRLGYATGNWLLYVTGGGALARLTNEYGDPVDFDDRASVRKTRWGWTVGGGAEVALGGAWSAKAEYLYIDFREFNATPILAGSAGVVRFHDEMHVARVGLNYRFGGPVVARY